MSTATRHHNCRTRLDVLLRFSIQSRCRMIAGTRRRTDWKEIFQPAPGPAERCRRARLLIQEESGLASSPLSKYRGAQERTYFTDVHAAMDDELAAGRPLPVPVWPSEEPLVPWPPLRSYLAVRFPGRLGGKVAAFGMGFAGCRVAARRSLLRVTRRCRELENRSLMPWTWNMPISSANRS